MWVNRQSGNADATTYTVASAVSATNTTITLSSTQGLRSTGFIQLDSEVIAYTNIVGNQLQNCWRGQNGTTAATHTVGTVVYNQYLPCVNIWPTPASGTTYTLVYWRMRRIQDAGSGVNIADIPFRFVNCFVAGLAYMLSVKLAGVDPQRVMGLKADYDQQFDLAAQEDREKASIRFVPRNLFYAR